MRVLNNIRFAGREPFQSAEIELLCWKGTASAMPKLPLEMDFSPCGMHLLPSVY